MRINGTSPRSFPSKLAAQATDQRSLQTVAPSPLLRVLRPRTTNTIQRIMELSLLPCVEDRYLNLGISSEGGNDVRIVGNMLCSAMPLVATLYGCIGM